ncbi:MAG: hypothetical protein M5R36_05625 [Deltaproteobacteria bacterium]|nr:hypothetical protein [Deltaproteobacteria bacterium]
MNANDVMRELEKMGTEQNRKVYKRHGAGGEPFRREFRQSRRA